MDHKGSVRAEWLLDNIQKYRTSGDIPGSRLHSTGTSVQSLSSSTNSIGSTACNTANSARSMASTAYSTGSNVHSTSCTAYNTGSITYSAGSRTHSTGTSRLNSTDSGVINTNSKGRRTDNIVTTLAIKRSRVDQSEAELRGEDAAREYIRKRRPCEVQSDKKIFTILKGVVTTD